MGSLKDKIMTLQIISLILGNGGDSRSYKWGLQVGNGSGSMIYSGCWEMTGQLLYRFIKGCNEIETEFRFVISGESQYVNGYVEATFEDRTIKRSETVRSEGKREN